MLTNWFTASFPSKPPIPGFRYKQTSVSFINDGSATYDTNGYLVNLTNTSNFRGDACMPKWTYDPTKGEIFALAFTRTRDPSKNTSSNIQYQTGTAIANSYISNSDTGQIMFNGQAYTIGTIINNRVDIAYVVDMTAHTVKLYYSLVVGGAKTLLAEKPFLNIAASNLIQMYVDAGPSQALNVLAYNNPEFAL